MPMKFARESWPFVLPFVPASAMLFIFDFPVWGGVVAVFGFGVLLFFRDPPRHFEGDTAVVLAAADGLVTGVDTVEDPDMGSERFLRVVTFLSAFDVHVQRNPVSGEVLSSALRRGLKVAAFRHDAGEVNESHLTVIQRSGSAENAFVGDLVGVRQISGLMARRVVCYLTAGQKIDRGDHLGLIKFGSRVDLLVPETYKILVKKGDRLQNGVTPVAEPQTDPLGATRSTSVR
jgi:phosphatidylserine decarboxylase